MDIQKQIEEFIVNVDQMPPHMRAIFIGIKEWLNHQQSIISQQATEKGTMKEAISAVVTEGRKDLEKLQDWSKKVEDEARKLRKENAALESEIERLTQGLKWYSDNKNYELTVPVNNFIKYASPIQIDGGSKANSILEGCNPNNSKESVNP